jgi:glycosyltransferase involved in cell wall biosynthesis
VDGFTLALSKILREEELRKRLGMNGRNIILERYEIRGLVRRIEMIYDDLLG